MADGRETILLCPLDAALLSRDARSRDVEATSREVKARRDMRKPFRSLSSL